MEARQVSFGATGGEAGGAAPERTGQLVVAATNFVRSEAASRDLSRGLPNGPARLPFG